MKLRPRIARTLIVREKWRATFFCIWSVGPKQSQYRGESVTTILSPLAKSNMPFRRTRRFKSRRRRTRRFRGRRRGGMSTRRMAQFAFQRVDPEKKVLDVVTSADPLLGSPEIVLLNGISEGTDKIQRIGDSCKILSLQWKVTVRPSGVTNSPILVRLMFLIDFQANQALPSEANVIQFVALPIISPRNLAKNKRFKVLHNSVIRVDPVSFFFAYRQGFMKLNLKPRWASGGSSITDLDTGSLVMFIWSNIAAGPEAPRVDIVTRIRFVG